MSMITHTGSPEETRALAANLAARLRAGDVVLLRGPLGAGKTEFVRGLARGLGCADAVSSPSFAIVNDYSGGRLRLLHLDLYRLEAVDLYDLGVDDARDGAVIAIEWPERLACPEPGAIFISISPCGEGRAVEMPAESFWAQRGTP